MPHEMGEIAAGFQKGFYLVWVDDKVSASLSPEYITKNAVTFVPDLVAGQNLCHEFHALERMKKGRAETRYRISRSGEDYVVSEDLTEEQMTEVLRKSKYAASPPKVP